MSEQFTPQSQRHEELPWSPFKSEPEHESPVENGENSGIVYETLPEEQTIPKTAKPFPGTAANVADTGHMLPEHGSDDKAA